MAKPRGIRTDNGSEFTSYLFQKWLHENDIEWIKIQKGKPQQNAIIERFNKTYREDILDAHLFFSQQQVKHLTAAWIEDYNNERPHQALNFKSPTEYEAALGFIKAWASEILYKKKHRKKQCS